ncbi:ribonuclease H-like domain-containing protein [Collybia nuda]|uniref:RNA exonuclease 4 n=1 Tax=Collybia nuda TaxID=64659 RepID=A0A9P5YAP1_9AGAR|nr:ribonuclease H-like domain-containing protein [Collybia nuda]
MKNGESLSALRKMIFGQMEYTDAQQLPGKYLSLDCEMVGVGIDGTESSLARVSLVNFYGAIQLDEFVRQRERVVDYRTQFSGIRASDMIKAKPFEEIQKQVADLVKDRILVGHAVYNDLKALLLSHPRPQTRDTQYYAGKFKVSRSKYVALRNLVKQELNVTIQSGEHSSVTDARATMAVYRLHRKEWENGTKQLAKTADTGKKRKRGEKKDHEGAEADEAGDGDGGDVMGGKNPPGGGRKGVSSGLTTIVRRGTAIEAGEPKEKKKWWKELAGNTSQLSKGSLRL